MTVPGVGPIVALNFIATVDDASRFAKATDVGAYLGLTPRRYQSGEIDYSGRISKRGDGAMRTLLFEAANVLITRVRRFSPLKSCAARRTQGVQEGRGCCGTQDRCGDAAPVARRDHLRLEQRGDAGMTN